jgi:anti-sigma-K factor RskA
MKCEQVRPELFGLINAELDEVEFERVRSHCLSCSSCASEGDALRSTIASLQSAAPIALPTELKSAVLDAAANDEMGRRLAEAVPVLPPDRLKERVLSTVRAEGADRPERAVHRKVIRLRPREWVFAAAAVFALVFGGFMWLRLDDGGTGTPPGRIPRGHDMQTFALEGRVDSEATLTHYAHDNFRLSMSMSGYDPNPAGTYYAVWLRGPRGDVALGGFRLKRPDDITVPFAIAVDPAEYQTVLVTLEPEDGDPLLNGEVVSRGVLDREMIHHGTYEK